MTLQGWRITTLVTSLIVVALMINFGLMGWNAAAIKHAIDATGAAPSSFFRLLSRPQASKAFGRLLLPDGRCEIGVGSVLVSLHLISFISVSSVR